MRLSSPPKDLREPTVLAQWIRRLAAPIILGWVLVVIALTVLVPSLEVVAAKNAVSMSPADAPSMQAMADMGRLFGESESDSIALIVLESDSEEPLGDEAHAYYDQLLEKLRADPDHVRNIQDTWGDPLTEAAAQSSDGRA
ncbi:MMPL family RND transporter, partial [Mycobacterium sp. ITM-2017-0098]